MVTRGLNCGPEGLSTHLPKIKCPRRAAAPSADESPKLPQQQRSPKTPRRRDGRVHAGAAFSLFFRSPVSSPRGASLEHPLNWPFPLQAPPHQLANLPLHQESSLLPPLVSCMQPVALSPRQPPGWRGDKASGGDPWFSSSPLQSPGSVSSGGVPNDAWFNPSCFHLPWVATSSSSSFCTPQLLSSSLCSQALVSPTSPSLPHPLCSFPCSPAASPRSRTRALSNNPRATAQPSDPRLEASESANEDLLLFFYQVDLNMRLQRALNQDQYEPAQQLREKIAEVDREIARVRDVKLGGVSAKDDAQDKGIIHLSLKAELSRAVEQEEYELAAELINKIGKLETEMLAATAAAMVAQKREYQFRLGQRVRHALHGYVGVVAGMDPVCCETEKWRETSGLEPALLSRPFYQVLVDVKEGLGFPVGYVPESSLEPLQDPCRDRFDHPYVYLLFLGMDTRGDFIPCQQLRDKYNAPRHEVTEDDD